MTEFFHSPKIASRKYCGRFEITASQIVGDKLYCGIGDDEAEAKSNFGQAVQMRADVDGYNYFRRTAYLSDFQFHAA
jgi:hypothetical protein